MHACFVFGILLDSQLFASVSLKAGGLLCSFLARHCRLHRNFQHAPCVLDGFLKFTIFRINEINASEPSSIVECGLVSFAHSCFFSILSCFSQFEPYILQAIRDLVSSWFKLLSVSLQTTSLWRFLFQHCELCESFPRI